jgi:two-component sensor histidine kinase/PAS domain-containing protein
LPILEQRRIAAIRKSGLLDRSGREQFNHITQHVRIALDVPVAIISIVDEHRQVFAGHSGLPSPWDARGETPMTHSFCQHVVEQNAPLIVTDANLHELVRRNHAIADLGVIAYLGVPIHLDRGELVGALAAIDTQPRVWTERDLASLQTLARIVEREIAVGFSELKYRRLFADMQEGYYIASAVRGSDGKISDLRLDEINPAFERLTLLNAGTSIGRLVSDVFPTTEGPAVNRSVLETGQTMVFAERWPATGRWLETRARRLDDDHVAAVVTDISERKEREAQDEILQQELAHRLKNTLATVQAIASQTLRPVEDRAYVEAFEQRLATLSSAHDILFRRDWQSALVRPVVANLMDKLGMTDRVNFQGPDIEMGPRATLSTSLILHELATNAMKYGALSNDTGRVELAWDIKEGPTFQMTWSEIGGPSVEQPTSKGFGSRLIRMGLVGAGGVDVDYDPSGLRAIMSATLQDLQSR